MPVTECVWCGLCGVCGVCVWGCECVLTNRGLWYAIIFQKHTVSLHVCEGVWGWSMWGCEGVSVEKGSLEFTMKVEHILYYVCTVTHIRSSLSHLYLLPSTLTVHRKCTVRASQRNSPLPLTSTHPHHTPTHTHTSDENPESTGRLLGFRGNVAKWLATLPLQEERETKWQQSVHTSVCC